MISHELPNCPWSKVSVDLFEFNQKDYLATVDYFSNFIEIDRLEQTKSQDIIHKIKAQIARYGIPDTLVSDNGPQFSSEEFQKFAKKWGFKHPQSNGLPENAVKTVKRLMKRAQIDQGDTYYIPCTLGPKKYSNTRNVHQPNAAFNVTTSKNTPTHDRSTSQAKIE